MPDDELDNFTLEARIINAGHIVTRLGKYVAFVDGQRSYRRAGSDKRPKGWQITLRDGLRSDLLNGQGYLIVGRGRGLLIPLAALRELIGNEVGPNNTVDIFTTFGAVTAMECKGVEYDVSQFLLS